MFRGTKYDLNRLCRRLSHYDWTAIVGSFLVLAFCLLVIVPLLGYQAKHKQSADYENENKRIEIPSTESGDDRLATYTLWLTIFTGILALSTIALWWQTKRLAVGAETQAEDMKASIAVARMAAEAAKKSADAAMGVEIPRPILVELRFAKETHGLRANLRKGKLIAKFVNHGRTSAVITHNALVWHVGKTIDQYPGYPTESVSGVPATTIVPEGRPYEFSREFEITEEEAESVLNRNAVLWVWGFVGFRDFLEIERSAGFGRILQTIRHDSREVHGRFVYGCPPSYDYRN